MATVAESDPTNKENSKPITQAISAKQKQTVVSDVLGGVAHLFKAFCRLNYA